MSLERPIRRQPLDTSRPAAVRNTLHFGSWQVSVKVAAWGLSAILHGGLLTACYFITWSPTPASHPTVAFAAGDQAARIQVLLVPRPDPAEEEPKEEPPEDTPAAKPSPDIPVTTEAAVVPPSEKDGDREPRDNPDTVFDDVDVSADAAPSAMETTVEDVSDVAPSARAVPPALRPEQVELILDSLLRRLERLLRPPATSAPAARQPPPVVPPVEEAVVTPTEEVIESDASNSETVGVETGIETLDLPTPIYPSLSRKRGEKGLVVLRVEVLPDGTVGEITVLRDPGYDRLTKAAISAARKGRFKPASRDGHPIRATVRIPFRFVLR